MNLLCLEHLGEGPFAKKDSKIYEDPRVLKNLLEEEKNYIPSANYFLKSQNDVKPFMRKVLATWMMEVCDVEGAPWPVFPLSVNLLDRFTATTRVSRSLLQAVACACLLIAAKLRHSTPLSISRLSRLTDDSVPPSLVTALECVVLCRLGWMAGGVTAADVLQFLAPRLPWASPPILALAHNMLRICYTEPQLVQTAPSVMAVASLVVAVRDLRPGALWLGGAEEELIEIVGAERTSVEAVIAIIEEAAREVVAGDGEGNREDTEPPRTPTDIRDVQF